MIQVSDSSIDKRVANARRGLKAIDRAGGVPELWREQVFKYLGHVQGRPVFAVRKTVVYIAGKTLHEARPHGDLW